MAFGIGTNSNKTDAGPVKGKQKEMYAGIPSVEFDCIITILKQQINTRLIYYKEENRWVLVYQ